MLCPECGQGNVLEIRIRALEQNAYLCDECEAMWFRRDEVGTRAFVQFSAFMKEHGLQGVWSEIVVKDGG